MKYIHTNIVSNDWKKLAKFYETVFKCERVLPERNLKGKWIDEGTGINGVHIEGVHLRLPGYGENGPTLEIFQYNKTFEPLNKQINRQGFGHIAFRVKNVEEILNSVIKNGGGKLSDIMRKEIVGLGKIIVVYAKDPEGNFIELQKIE